MINEFDQLIEQKTKNQYDEVGPKNLYDLVPEKLEDMEKEPYKRWSPIPKKGGLFLEIH